MGLLFLDPLVQVAIVTTLVGCWVVWRGGLRFWFGRSGGWTPLIWPLPAVLVVTPLAVGPLRAALAIGLDAVGHELSDLADALVFAGLYLVPLVGLTVWPPRWLLPAWARARLVTPTPPSNTAAASMSVSDGLAVPAPSGATVMPACLGRRGHGSRARWIWQVDAVSGVLTVADGQVRFRPDPPPGTSLATSDLSGSGESGPPADPSTPAAADVDRERSGTRTGATWGRRYLDADLDAVDQVRVHARRLWANDGVMTLELAGRPSAHLWVSDVARLQEALASTKG